MVVSYTVHDGEKWDN